MIINKTVINHTKLKILNLLKTNTSVSGEQIKTELGISRTAVWKSIQGIVDLGYEIKRIRGKGYALVKSPDLLYPWELNFSLKNKFEFTHFLSIDSTNKYARTLEPLHIITAEKQTEGRGRLGRSWFSIPGGVYFSMVIRPNCSFEEMPSLPLIIATSLAKTIRSTLNIEAEIKWPNDLLVDGRKIAGILVELSGEADAPQKAIIGVGINVNQSIDAFPSELADQVTTLSYLKKVQLDRRQLLNDLLEETSLSLIKPKESVPNILNTWREYSCTLGKEITVNQVSRTIKGIARDIDERGALIIDTDRGEERILSGDIFVSKNS